MDDDHPVVATGRLSPLLEASPAQKRFLDRFSIADTAGLKGPINVLVRAPLLGEAITDLGELLVSPAVGLPPRLREFAILLVAKHCGAEHVWTAHVPKALECGLSWDAIAAIRGNEESSALGTGEAAVARFVVPLLESGKVSDECYGKVAALLGQDGLIHLTALTGYYRMVAMSQRHRKRMKLVRGERIKPGALPSLVPGRSKGPRR